MKRDWDIIRLILLDYENDSEEFAMPEAVSEEQILYHIQLLIDAGFIADAIVTKGQMGEIKGVTGGRLTMQGHDFLDSIRHDTVWREVRSAILRLGGKVALSIVSDIAQKCFSKAMGL